MNKKAMCVIMVLVLSLGCGIIAAAQNASFSGNDVSGTATLTSIGNTGGAATAQNTGDTCYAFAQVVACKSDGTYLKGNSDTQTGYVSVTCTYTGTGCKQYKGVHSLKNDVYRPLASKTWYISK